MKKIEITDLKPEVKKTEAADVKGGVNGDIHSGRSSGVRQHGTATNSDIHSGRSTGVRQHGR